MTRVTIRALALFVAIGWGTTALAQGDMQFGVFTTVKPGMNQQYEEYIGKYVEAAKKLGDVQSWAAFQTTVGGASGEYAIILRFSSWADRDAWTAPPEILSKAFGEEEAAKIERTGQAAVAHSYTAINQRLPDSTATGGGSIAANYHVTRTKIRPGKQSDYRMALSQIWKAEAKATGAPPRTLRRTITGDRSIFTSSAPFANGAERDKWPAFGDYMSAMYTEAEIRNILTTIQGAIAESQWIEAAFRPDLSNLPATATSNQ